MSLAINLPIESISVVYVELKGDFTLTLTPEYAVWSRKDYKNPLPLSMRTTFTGPNRLEEAIQAFETRTEIPVVDTKDRVGELKRLLEEDFRKPYNNIGYDDYPIVEGG